VDKDRDLSHISSGTQPCSATETKPDPDLNRKYDIADRRYCMVPHQSRLGCTLEGSRHAFLIRLVPEERSCQI